MHALAMLDHCHAGLRSIYVRCSHGERSLIRSEFAVRGGSKRWRWTVDQCTLRIPGWTSVSVPIDMGRQCHVRQALGGAGRPSCAPSHLQAPKPRSPRERPSLIDRGYDYYGNAPSSSSSDKEEGGEVGEHPGEIGNIFSRRGYT